MGQGWSNLTLVHDRMPLRTGTEGTPLRCECGSTITVEVRTYCPFIDIEVLGCWVAESNLSASICSRHTGLAVTEMNQPKKITVESPEIALDPTDFEDGGGPFSESWRSKELDETQAALTEWVKEKRGKN
jgi:hypothetical protein